MSFSVDNRVFLGYCTGLVGLLSGGLLYNIASDLYKIKYKKSSDNLRLPYNINDIKVSSFINVGGILGGILGISYGYHGKPLISLLLENKKKF